MLGTSFRFATLATDMSGFAQIPAGSKGHCTNEFDFTGISGKSKYAIELPGQMEGDFTLKASPDLVSWSPCGGTTAIMNMNTQCYISPTRDQALIAVCYPFFFPLFLCVFWQLELSVLTSVCCAANRSIASAARSPSTCRSTGGSVSAVKRVDAGRRCESEQLD